MRFDDQLDLQLLLEGPLTDDDRQSITYLIHQLDDLLTIQDFNLMPGGIHPPSHYLGNMRSLIKRLKTYERQQPRPTPEQIKIAKQQRQAAAQNIRKTITQLIKGSGHTLLFSSIDKNGVQFVQPDGSTSGFSNDKLIANSQQFVRALDTYYDKYKHQYDKLKEEIAWMKSVGFNPGAKSLELARWKYLLPETNKRPAGLGTIMGHTLDFWGDAFDPFGEREESKRRIPAWTVYKLKIAGEKKPQELQEWEHAQIEELMDTVGPVHRALETIGGMVEEYAKIGTQYVNYIVKIDISGVYETKIEVSSAEIKSTKSVIKILNDQLNREFGSRRRGEEEMNPV